MLTSIPVGQANFDWIVEHSAKLAIEKAKAHKPKKNNTSWGTFLKKASIPVKPVVKKAPLKTAAQAKKTVIKKTASTASKTAVPTTKKITDTKSKTTAAKKPTARKTTAVKKAPSKGIPVKKTNGKV